MPIVSVIIPLYNKSNYIARALNSVFAQTLTDFEVLVIDDGSTDNSLEIVCQYSDSRLKIIEQNNAGPGSARNRGIREAKAKYVAFLDADDEWLPDYLSSSLVIFQTELACEVCVSSRFMKVVGTIVKSEDMLYQMTGQRYRGLWAINESISDNELQYIINAFHTDTVFVSRQLCLNLGGFSEMNNYGEDWHLWIQFLFNHRIFFNNVHLAVVHSEASGICSQGLLKNPIQAYYLEAINIREKCTKDNKNLLERFYSLHALRDAHVRAGVGNLKAAKYLVENFPGMKKISLKKYLFLRAKLALPKTYQLLQIIVKKFK